MKLYEFPRAICEALDQIDPETGEWIGQQEYEALNLELNQKVLYLGKRCKELDADIEAIQAECKRLQAMLKSTQRKRESMQSLIEIYIEPGEKLQDAQCCVSWRKSSAVNVIDYVAVPDEYLRLPPNIPPPVDKAAVAEAIKAGKEVPGAIIEERWNLQIK